MVSICPSAMWVQTSSIVRFGLLIQLIRTVCVASMSALHLEKPSMLIEGTESAGPKGRKCLWGIFGVVIQS